MDLRALLGALPWWRRVWRALSPQGQVLALVGLAVAAIAYALQGRQGLIDRD